MKEQQQNIAAAAFLSERTGQPVTVVYDPLGSYLDICSDPATHTHDSRELFSQSLDSMALLEAAMSTDEMRQYLDLLQEAVLHPTVVIGPPRYIVQMRVWRTTPAQRLAAFLRAVGLWREEDEVTAP